MFGPLLGGWLTDQAGWQWLFFLNIPVGALLVAMLMFGLAPERSNLADLARADWIGIAGLILFLGAGTVVLEEGQREQWFESAHILQLTAITFIGAALTAWSQLTRDDPVVKLRLLRERSFAGAFAVSVIMGGAFYTVLYVLPVFLATVAGYNASQTGTVAMYSGAAAFFFMPVVPFATKVIDLRLVVAFGLLLFAISCWMDLGLTAESGRDQFFWSQIVRGIGQTFIFLPLSQAALAGVSEEDAPDASGLFNMARNLGGSVGLALTAVVIDTRQAFHAESIASTISANGPLAAERLSQSAAAMMAEGSDPTTATQQALAQLRGLIAEQSLVMTYADCFWLFGIAMIAAIPAVLLLKKPADGQAMAIH